MVERTVDWRAETTAGHLGYLTVATMVGRRVVWKAARKDVMRVAQRVVGTVGMTAELMGSTTVVTTAWRRVDKWEVSTAEQWAVVKAARLVAWTESRSVEKTAGLKVAYSVDGRVAMMVGTKADLMVEKLVDERDGSLAEKMVASMALSTAASWEYRMVAKSVGMWEVQKAAPMAETMVWRKVERLARYSVVSTAAMSAMKMADRLAGKKAILKVVPMVVETVVQTVGL